MLGSLSAVLVLLVVAAVWVVTHAGASLGSDPTALAQVRVDSFGGTVRSISAVDHRGRRVALVVDGGRVTPRHKLRPGERLAIDVVVRRPGWVGWALGSSRHEHLSVTAPTARVTDPYLTVASGGDVRVQFDQPISAAAYSGRTHVLGTPSKTVDVGARSGAGATRIAVAARAWEQLGAPATVTWFPQSSNPVVVASPRPGTPVAPSAPILLRTAKPVDDVLGSSRPTISPSTPGEWKKRDEHTLAFTPSGFGAPFATKLHIHLPRAVAVTGPDGSAVHTTREIDYTTPPGSKLRLQQLLADAGYLPLNWKASGAPVPATEQAQVRAAVRPPKGAFHWRWSNAPGELRKLWTPGQDNAITRGAIMKFQDRHHLTVDALAGPSMWRALMEDVIHRRRLDGGYSYVYVHRDVPQLLTLWHNGQTILTSPGNTGVPSAPTEIGTFPVFEHLPVTTMSGTNPDGSTYNDPGIKWVSYFNGGDALHSFNRASFGTPQSLGCVELPEDSAAKLYPYTPIGTLVTIES